MNQNAKLNIVLVGLGFGGSFIPIYRDHPNVETLGLYDTNGDLTRAKAEKFHADKIYNSFEAILADPHVDAVHLVTPIPAHAHQTIAVLESGKHCACTVPMATSLEDIRRITEATRKSGKNYMMMETTLYTYQFLYVKKLLDEGTLGRIQFLRGSHYQDMSGWPDYWMGLPPMWYGTHAIAPMRVLSGSRIRRVVCFGSGVMEDRLTKQYDNPYPVESALFEFENGLKGEATRSLFETAREYQEGLFVYGSDMSFEWGFRDNDLPTLTTQSAAEDGRRGKITVSNVTPMPNAYETLPEPIQKYTISDQQFDPLNPQKSLEKGTGGGHHGSHPHLVHEFLMSIIEERKPRIDEVLGGNITGAGICAHESAMHGGVSIEIPLF